MLAGVINCPIESFSRRCKDTKHPLMILISALPAILAHSGIIVVPAMIMSIIGGLLIYGTIITFGMFFREEQDF